MRENKLVEKDDFETIKNLVSKPLPENTVQWCRNNSDTVLVILTFGFVAVLKLLSSLLKSGDGKADLPGRDDHSITSRCRPKIKQNLVNFIDDEDVELTSFRFSFTRDPNGKER